MPKTSKVLLGTVLALVVAVSAMLALIADALIRTPDFERMRSEIEVTTYLPGGEKGTRKVGPKAPGWVPIKQISNHLLMAVIASEDAAFFQHDGVDYHEMREAIKKDLQEKRWARGASTITQQVIKNTFLTREKTLWRKVKEILWARKLDKEFSKSEILCFYVNLVEWGPGIYGIRNAARHYFQVSPAELTAKQGAFLAMLLPSPVRYYSYFRKKELSAWASKRVAQILRVMNRMGFIEEEEYRVALSESLWGETPLSPWNDETLPSEDSATPDIGNMMPVIEPRPVTPPASAPVVDTLPTSAPPPEVVPIVPPETAEPSPEPDRPPSEESVEQD